MTNNVAAELDSFIRTLDAGVAEDAQLANDVDLFDYGYLDSFGIVALIEHVEARYGVDLSTEDFYEGSLRTIGGIAALISARRPNP
jgi:acyl carrier protein